MSFRCEHCKKVGHKPLMAVIETRPKIYPQRTRPARVNAAGEAVETEMVDKGGEGWEIVREGLFCDQACASASATNKPNS